MKHITLIVTWTGTFLLLTNCSQMTSHLKTPLHSPQEKTLNAVLWFQTSGEARALSYQAFNMAKMMLDQDLNSSRRSSKKRAIVVDVDETILDNSPYQAQSILTGKGYPEGWDIWVEKATARPIPGALDFLRYASRKGVAIFYITNRKNLFRTATLENLKTLGFPVDPQHVMLRTMTKSKVSRRQKVLKDHRIILLMGDALGDFSEIFEGPLAQRQKNVDRWQQQFGKKFIVLPNPMYGAWEKTLRIQ